MLKARGDEVVVNVILLPNTSRLVHIKEDATDSVHGGFRQGLRVAVSIGWYGNYQSA